MSDLILSPIKKEKENDPFSDFFINASDEEQIRIFNKAAKMANEDQREIFRKANLGLDAN